MTAYFDELHDRLNALNSADPQWEDFEALRVLEHRLVFDCTVNVMFPEVPEVHRRAVHEAVARWGVDTRSEILGPVDLESFGEHVERIHLLVGDLHTVAHAIHRDPDCPFGDNPRAGVLGMFLRGEEERDRAAAEAMGTTVEAHIARILDGGA